MNGPALHLNKLDALVMGYLLFLLRNDILQKRLQYNNKYFESTISLAAAKFMEPLAHLLWRQVDFGITMPCILV